MFKYHTVANDVHGYYVSVKMNCHIKSNVKGEEKTGMLNGIKVVMEEGTEVIRNSLGSTVGSGRGYNGTAERKLHITEAVYGYSHSWNAEEEMVETAVKYRRVISESPNLGIFHIHIREGGLRDGWHGSQLI